MLHDIWVLMIEKGWLLALLRGAGITLLIGFLGAVIGLATAIPLAILRWRRVPALSQLVDAYSIVVRGVPGLLVIYLLFFGSVDWVQKIASAFGYAESAENAYPLIIGIAAIAAISCAYSIEVIRGALQAVPAGLLEAARSLSLSPRVTFSRVTLPLALRLALGGINNVWQMTIKDTSLVSVVGMQELMRAAAVAAGITRSPLLFYCMAAAMFFGMTVASQVLFNRVEKHFNRGFTRG
ncbi:ABC transporter permease subunit [Mesorhizobium sp. M4B.F.Ca.ET.215.01.1.1]|uniref:ABC transporter permease subunit n=2 Tax=Mesorhizobium TaxID=68287 RepID=UPI000FCC6424|nr:MULTISPECIES: ABC transporter permease subunit [unclassified Mesorhizobium]RUW24909.1 ABC transporter permease subunit [Mesorhizobium sp. M4B.F.Ca.ET.013.02.1.1]RVD44269.1 ABC transporter permease subunit [Mesorhizobium sp. M4B.F.Ca.ET.019.03.1.1]RWF62282.1 MAG: ABC transporter permease subunit [Mesorhizobium sp.]TGQ09491.1 ABC transporter permease subunit [Mesorhizobium sp. M4B.F.Ca.ET.215.01.1.1]TGQ31202.1 ABC transporter permease subunit [Mesorhizobium sp. M4B.F.Ca.ET.214.01.1.1]